ncbi:MAG TPA: potassium channel family protein [Thermoanaerobaculia bacterium]|nr:potassium channel family protein [Thermoanaerobaculia bacterium]
MLNKFYELAANRNQWILSVFLFYVALVFLFGAIYFLIYSSNRRAFAFNSDIIRSQSRAVEIDSYSRLEQLELELRQLKQLKQDLVTMDADPTLGREFGGLFLTSTFRGAGRDYTVIWPKARNAFPGGGEPPPTNLRITTLDGEESVRVVGSSHYDLPQTASEFRSLCDKWISDWEATQEEVQAVLDSLGTDSPKVWSYWDFLYFSAITQFTVGYGDILPNSTFVRLVVLLQTCIAALLLVVVINVAFTTGAS